MEPYHFHNGVPCAEFFCDLPYDKPERAQVPPELEQEFARIDREIRNREAAKTHDLESETMRDKTSTRAGEGDLPTYVQPELLPRRVYNMDFGPISVHDIRMFCLEQADHGHTGSAAERAMRQAKAASILEHYVLTGEVREPDSKTQHGSSTPPLSD